MMEERKNKMAVAPMNKLFLKMGLPMIISMVLQALYNVVDSIFVANMGSMGAIANQALTYAFPIQIMIIAVGVGTGVGINALLSKSLGENDKEKVNKIAGNGIFLSICIYFIFLLFGIFASDWFISLFTKDDEILKLGTIYLKICTCLSFGSIAYTVYERFLQATGKTLLSTIAQISGALVNIILDYIFIYPLEMGVAGAALATVIGQFVSLFVAMWFHYKKNDEVDGNIKYIKPEFKLIKEVYSIGVSAALMQALLAVMMAGMNAILGLSSGNQTVLIGSFGIYYKIQQIALFSAFGLSNTIISILSFNYGMKDKKRIDDCIKYGIVDTVVITLILSIFFEIFAYPLSSLFGLAGGAQKEIIGVCTNALRISSLGFIFMGISVSVQGILQSIGYALKPLIIALLRLVIFVFPIAYLFTLSDNITSLVWWTFPIAEFLTATISLFILRKSYNKKIKFIEETNSISDLIVSISREHGTNGKEIGRLVAKKLGISFYDKDEIKEFAINNNLFNKDYSEEELYDNYLSLDANKEAIINQAKVIRKIAEVGSAVIVGRSADYIIKNNKNLIKVFIYAPMDYKIANVMNNYGDSEKDARRHIIDSNKARSNYYSVIANQVWGDKSNYDLCLDSSIGNKETAKVIVDYVANLNKK